MRPPIPFHRRQVMPRSIPPCCHVHVFGRPCARRADEARPRGLCPCPVLVIGAGAPAAHPADPTGPRQPTRRPCNQPFRRGSRLPRRAAFGGDHHPDPACEARNATANYALGLIYMRGTGDAATAAKLSHRHFRNAAQRGHVGAVFEVAFQFERGSGTERDVKRAIRLYRLAAQSNHLNA